MDVTFSASSASPFRLPDVAAVYNMDVESDHVYYVGDLPALVHNNCNPLRENMENDGEEFGTNDQAHHIVAQKDPAMQVARNLLKDYGVDIHQSENGAVLDEYFHQTLLHRDPEIWARYVENVTDLLYEAAESGGKQGILDALDSISEILEAGGYP